VAPGQLFPGPVLDVKAPASAGWLLLDSGVGGMRFGREDPSTGKTYIAQILAFKLLPFGTPDEFLAIVRDGWAKDTSPERFKVIDTDFRLSTERPYPCVRFLGNIQDMQARTRQGTAALPLHTRSLYCQNPIQRDLGFMIEYSQRGGAPDPDLDSHALSFIDGVQVKQP